MVTKKLKLSVFLFLYYIVAFIRFAVNGFKNKKLLVLYLYADKKKYSGSFKFLTKILSHFIFFEKTIIKIDNFDEFKEVTGTDGTFDIPGDNQFWEFSGWQKGIDFAKNNLSDKTFDSVLFVNDAFLNDPYIDWIYYIFRYNSITLSDLGNTVIGKVDQSGRNMKLLGKDVGKWVRSNFLAVPYKIACNLELSYLTEEAVDKIITERFTKDLFEQDAPMSYELKLFLIYWINAGWQQYQEITDKNWSFIRSKLTAILNERMLTFQLLERDAAIINSADIRPIKNLFALELPGSSNGFRKTGK